MCSEEMCIQVSQFTGSSVEGLAGTCIFASGQGAPGTTYGRNYVSERYTARNVQY